MGAWIEIEILSVFSSSSLVAPYMGAWIEINLWRELTRLSYVAPYMGAWIEISIVILYPPLACSRSLHGSVD